MKKTVREIKGIGEKTQQRLKRLHVETVEDLVHYYPRCYAAYPDPVPIGAIVKGERCSVKAVLDSPVHVYGYGRKKVCTCLISDGRDQLFVRWYNLPYLKKVLSREEEYVFTGTPVFKEDRLMLEQPEYVAASRYHEKTETFQPVYRLTAGLSNRALQKAMKEVFKEYRAEEYLPETVRAYYNLPEENGALREIHFPTGRDSLNQSKKRIIFDEFFRFFSALELLKEGEEQEINTHVITMGEKERGFIRKLPYELTHAQKKVLYDIRNDFAGTAPMNRLIQGDVGSGKTIVAVIAMFAAVNHGYQAALMAPTEVLAAQHFETIRAILSPYGVRTGLLVSSLKAAQKRNVKRACQEGTLDILIGTQAVIQDSTAFRDLALVITDEQHRFGVSQRDALMKKGRHPHVLVMSATPIPRTLAMILYRDLSISIMDEMPSARLPIRNCVVGTNYRQTAWKFIQKEVRAGHQAFIICPMIEESETMELENVTDYRDLLSAFMPPDIRMEILHGRMSSQEKGHIMEEFAGNHIQILISTTVVEVGIDIPNATVMLIENAERYGLAQLHQLRGRVGRGKCQSYCIFMSWSDQEKALERLQIVGNSNDGFEIANADLKQRGPGDFFGTRQSGTLRFALGDIYTNADILQEASEAVQYLKDTDYDFMKIHPYSLERDLEFAKNL